MKLNDKDVNLFRVLNKSAQGRDLIDYLERLKRELFNPETVTPENLTGRKDMVKILNEDLINRIKLVNEDRVNNPNDYI